MIWERGGTIDVVNGSATLAGTGTTWATAAVLAGYGVILPDLKWYEIEAVNSSTEITLATPYDGPSASAQTYVIVPTSGANEKIHADIQEFLAFARSEVNTIGAKLTSLQDDYDAWKAAKIAEIDALIVTKTGELDALHAVKAGELNTLISDSVDAINALIAAKSAELDALKTAKEGDLDTLISDKTTEIDALISTKTSELDALHSAKESALDALITAKTNEINTLISDKTTALDGLISTKTAELDALKTAKEGELDTLISDKTTEINLLITTKTTELNDLITAKSAAADSMISTKEAAADAMIAAKQAEVDALLAQLAAGGGNTARNRIVNGGMMVAQLGSSESGITVSKWPDAVDMWRLHVNNCGTWRASQGAGWGAHSKSLKLTCEVAEPSLASNSYCFWTNRVEGQNLQDLKKGFSEARSLTLSGEVKSSKAGVIVVELFDVDNNRHIGGAVTIVAAATPQAWEVTFAGDTVGQFADVAAGSLEINLWVAAGVDFTSGALQTSWGSYVGANRAAGVSNWAAAVNDEIEFTAMQLEVGDSASDFVHQDFAEALEDCQRYCYELVDPSGGNTGVLNVAAYSGGNNYGYVRFPVEMMTAPIMNYSDVSHFVGRMSNLATCTAINTQGTHTKKGLTMYFKSSSAAGDAGWIETANSAASIRFLARP